MAGLRYQNIGPFFLRATDEVGRCVNTNRATRLTPTSWWV